MQVNVILEFKGVYEKEQLKLYRTVIESMLYNGWVTLLEDDWMTTDECRGMAKYEDEESIIYNYQLND